MSTRKQLPMGTWISFLLLHSQTTDQDMQALLKEAGVEVELDHISIENDRSGRSAYAIVSLPRQEVCNLLQRALLDNGQDKLLHGRPVVPRVPKNSTS